MPRMIWKFNLFGDVFGDLSDPVAFNLRFLHPFVTAPLSSNMLRMSSSPIVVAVGGITRLYQPAKGHIRVLHVAHHHAPSNNHAQRVSLYGCGHLRRLNIGKYELSRQRGWTKPWLRSQAMRGLCIASDMHCADPSIYEPVRVLGSQHSKQMESLPCVTV